jgi:hypothetical protein
MTVIQKSKPQELSGVQKKLIAESLARIAVSLACGNHLVQKDALSNVRTILTEEFLALNAPAAPKGGA